MEEDLDQHIKTIPTLYSSKACCLKPLNSSSKSNFNSSNYK